MAFAKKPNPAAYSEDDEKAMKKKKKKAMPKHPSIKKGKKK
jgi:hypothetical protein